MFEMIGDDLDKFVFTTIPKDLDYIQCRVTRAKQDVYWLHAEHPVNKKKVSHIQTRNLYRNALPRTYRRISFLR
jgi:hypothetical protein